MIYKCIDKALAAAGVSAGLRMRITVAHDPEITDRSESLGGQHRLHQAEIMDWQPNCAVEFRRCSAISVCRSCRSGRDASAPGACRREYRVAELLQ